VRYVAIGKQTVLGAADSTSHFQRIVAFHEAMRQAVLLDF
jgi:hypothetical protein